MDARFLIVVMTGCGRVGFDTAEQAPDPRLHTYTATIAECIDPLSPDPASCATTNGADQLVVDGRDGTTNEPWQSYVRFDLDEIAGHLLSVRLVMTATDDSKAGGPDSGDVWRVEPFDRELLATRAPAMVEPAPLERSQGSVDKEDVVEWELPLDSMPPALCLGIVTTSTTGGVNYWNLSGANPPRLVVETD